MVAYFLIDKTLSLNNTENILCPLLYFELGLSWNHALASGNIARSEEIAISSLQKNVASLYWRSLKKTGKKQSD